MSNVDEASMQARTSSSLHGCFRGEGRRPASRREGGRFGDGEGDERDERDDDDRSARGAPRRSRVLDATSAGLSEEVFITDPEQLVVTIPLSLDCTQSNEEHNSFISSTSNRGRLWVSIMPLRIIFTDPRLLSFRIATN